MRAYIAGVLLVNLCHPKAVQTVNASIGLLSHCSISSCGNPFGYLVFQRFHRVNIAWNYSRKEEDWCRIVLSMSDGSSRAGNLLRRLFISH